MAKTITITTVSTIPARVLLVERDERHPDGQALIASDGGTYKVGETPGVRALLSLQDKEGNDLVKRGRSEPEVPVDLSPFIPPAGDSGGANPGLPQGGEAPNLTPGEDGQTNTGSATPENPDPGADTPNPTAPPAAGKGKGRS